MGDNWDEGLREHREKVRKVLGIWRTAGTFGEATLGRVEGKLTDEDEDDPIFGRGGEGDENLRVSPPPPPGGIGKLTSYSFQLLKLVWIQVRRRPRSSGGERPSALAPTPDGRTTTSNVDASVSAVTDHSQCSL